MDFGSMMALVIMFRSITSTRLAQLTSPQGISTIVPKSFHTSAAIYLSRHPWGTYKVSVDGTETAEFSINDGVYLDALQKSIEYFNLSRCGCELSESVSKVFAHKACHNTPARIYGTEEFKDVTGGWHDAGDYGRYIVAAAKAVNAHEFIMPGTEDISAVEIGYKLHTPIENNLYEYITEQTI